MTSFTTQTVLAEAILLEDRGLATSDIRNVAASMLRAYVELSRAAERVYTMSERDHGYWNTLRGLLLPDSTDGVNDGSRSLTPATRDETILALTARVEAAERDAERWKEAKSVFYDVVPGDKRHYAWNGEMRSWDAEGSVMLPFRYLPKDMSITRLIDLSIRARKKAARIDAALNAKDVTP